MYIGLGEANFWGCEGCLPEFYQTCTKSFVGPSLQNFSTKIRDHEDLFLVWHPKKIFICFSGNVGCHFL